MQNCTTLALAPESQAKGHPGLDRSKNQKCHELCGQENEPAGVGQIFIF